MARKVHDGNTKVAFVTTISNSSAPTVAELNAGTDLSIFIPKDGLKVPANQNNVDNASLAETFDAEIPGSEGGTIEITMFRETPSDTAWDLCERDLEGYIVVRRLIDFSTAWTATQNIEVYPITMHNPVPLDTARNENTKFMVRMPVRSEPDRKAVVAA